MHDHTVDQRTSPHRTSDVVSAEIRAWMGRLNLRQRHIAAALGIGQAQVSMRLNGHVAWDTDEIDVLADLFGVDPAELTKGPSSQRRTTPDELGPKTDLTRQDARSDFRCTPAPGQPTGGRFRHAA